MDFSDFSGPVFTLAMLLFLFCLMFMVWAGDRMRIVEGKAKTRCVAAFILSLLVSAYACTWVIQQLVAVFVPEHIVSQTLVAVFPLAFLASVIGLLVPSRKELTPDKVESFFGSEFRAFFFYVMLTILVLFVALAAIGYAALSLDILY